MDNRPIGVFDSGLGGLCAVRELEKLLPKERIIYFGDTGRVPYGTKSEEIIKKYPITIPITEVATLLGMTPKTVRAAIESGNLGGVTWRTPGALNKGFNIPTSPFVRWYMQMRN